MPQARRTIQALLLCLLTAATSFAQTGAVAVTDEVLFRIHPTESGTYPMRVSQIQNTTLDMGPMGQQDIGGETVFEGRFRITPLGGGGAEMETVFDRFTMTLDHMGQETIIDSNMASGQPEAEALQPLLGKPILVQFDDTGRVLEVSGFSELMDLEGVEGMDDPEMAALTEMLEQAFSDDSMAAMAQQSQAIFPQDAVRVGDTWTSNFDISNGAIGEMSVETEYTFVEIAEHKGRSAAKLDIVMDVTLDGTMPMIEQMNEMFAQQGGSMDVDFGEFDSAGSVWIDIETGLTLDSTIEQTIEIAMNLSMEDQEMGMNMAMVASTRSQFFQIDTAEPERAVE